MAIKKIAKNIYELSQEGKMLVPGRIFASDKLLESIKKDKTLEQIKNVAMLPGIVKASIAMPDAHQGYGFPIGGVAAFDLKSGVISPGAVGYDINCGVRLLKTNLKNYQFLKKRERVVDEIYKKVPPGVGRKSEFRISQKDLDEVLKTGVRWAVKNGYGTRDDLEKCESSGKIEGAEPAKVSTKAKQRGIGQLGTLGAGNHFLEIQEVEKIFDKEIAKIFGLEKDQIVILIHTGSRGLGHQVASDFIHLMANEYGIENLPDRELINAPIDSKLGKNYRAAMGAAANFAFTNRQLISYQIRKSFEKFFPGIEMGLVYDVAHNIAKFEEHEINGRKASLCVHRKGATRSFGPSKKKELPEDYQKTGQPIFIPGSMGTASYVLVGTDKAEKISFSSTAHGAGRVMSRSKAMKTLNAEKVKKSMNEKNILLKANSTKGFLEEAPEVYKDVEEVVKVSHELGIGKRVARLRPLAVVKG